MKLIVEFFSSDFLYVFNDIVRLFGGMSVEAQDRYRRWRESEAKERLLTAEKV